MNVRRESYTCGAAIRSADVFASVYQVVCERLNLCAGWIRNGLCNLCSEFPIRAIFRMATILALDIALDIYLIWVRLPIVQTSVSV